MAHAFGAIYFYEASMARYRKIDPRIWNDKKFRELSDRAQLLFLFILTHPSLTSLGAMRASLPGLAAEKGWELKAFTEAFTEAFRKGMLKHDSEACFLWAPNFLKYNGPESPNVVKSWGSSLDLLPECDMKNELIVKVKAFAEALPEAFAEALPEDFRKSMPNQEQEQEQEQEQNKDILSGKPDLPDKEIPSKEKIPYQEIIDHLNLKSNKSFRSTSKEAQRLIKARWNAGFRLDDFFRVIDNKSCKWATDPKMVDYLRPETLFGNKFESYLNEAPPHRVTTIEIDLSQTEQIPDGEDVENDD